MHTCGVIGANEMESPYHLTSARDRRLACQTGRAGIRASDAAVSGDKNGCPNVFVGGKPGSSPNEPSLLAVVAQLDRAAVF